MAGAGRVVLRALRADDAETMFAYRADPEVARYQSWQPQSVDELRAFIASLARAEPYAPGTWYQLGIALPGDGAPAGDGTPIGGALIGDCGVHVLAKEPRQAEFGMTLARAWQGRGLATAALEALFTVLFGALGKHRVFGSIDPRNARSIALVERAGMRREAHHRESLWFKGEWADDVVYALLRREWLARARR